MRLAVLNSKLAGSELAVPIYTEGGIIFVNRGTTLTERYIESIKRIGINTVYISDGNDEITLQEILDSGIKIRVLKMLKSELESVTKNKTVNEKVIGEILTEIIKGINLSESAFMYHNMGQADDLMNLCLHSIEVTILSVIIGVHRKFDEKKLLNLAIGALLHDIGKLFKDDKEHPAIGYKLIKQNGLFSPTSYVSVLQHHENMDGSGYPDGFTGEKIYEFTKIISICDEYINCTTKRGMLPHEAMEAVAAQTPRRFDPDIYRDFTEAIYLYPNGLNIQLNNGLKGTVIMQNKNFPLRPIIMIEINGERKYINLMEILTLFIEKVVV